MLIGPVYLFLDIPEIWNYLDWVIAKGPAPIFTEGPRAFAGNLFQRSIKKTRWILLRFWDVEFEVIEVH